MSDLEEIYALFQNGALDDAQTAIESFLWTEQNNAKAFHLAGLIYKAQKNLAKAHQSVTQSLQINPKDPEVLNTMGNLFQDLGDIAKAQIAYEASLSIRGGYEAALKNLAFLQLKANHPLAAIEILEGLTAAQPENDTYRLGYALALKDSEQAARALEELSACKDQDSDEHIWLKATILFDLGEYEETIKLAKSLQGVPNYSTKSIALTSQILHMQDRWPEAEEYLTTLSQTHKGSAQVQYASAKAFIQSGHKNAAQNIIDQAMPRFGNDAADLLALQAQLSRDTGDYKGAYGKALAALTARQGDITLMRELALCAIANGQNNDALHIAQTALAQNPNDQFWIAIRATAGRADGQNYQYYYDYEKFVRAYDLNPPKGYSSIEGFNADLKTAVQEIHSFKKAPLDQSVRGGIQTSPNLIYFEHPILKLFFQMLDEPLNDYLNVIGHDQQHPLLRRNKGQYRIYSAWSVLLSAGGHHVNHIHPQGWISSSYYIDVPDGIEKDANKQGWIQFGEPPFTAPNLKAELQIAPKAGQVILFPSYMWHGTIPIQGGVSRMTLPFDVVPA